MTVRELRQELFFFREQDKKITIQDICMLMNEKQICPVCGEEISYELEEDQE